MWYFLVFQVHQNTYHLVHKLEHFELFQIATRLKDVTQLSSLVIVGDDEKELVPLPDLDDVDYIWMV